jgi:dTDP-glucose 4,6-dehydratase/UDP-glucose 4-epimerase
MRILVTGGTGFIGSALVRRLTTDGHSVRVLDNDLRGRAERLEDIRRDIELIAGDARNSDIVADAAAGIDMIVHLAALNGSENFYKSPDLVLDIGLRSMLAVLDACGRAGVGQLLVASSSEAYQTATRFPTPEEVPLVVPDVHNPRYSYGASKLISEVLTVNYGRRRLDRAIIFRPHNVYGPDMGWEHVIPQFAMRAADLADQVPDGELAFRVDGDGTQTRAFVHIADFVDGLMCVLNKGEHLGIYNIGTEEEITIGALAQKVVAVLGRTARLVPSAPSAGATARRCPDITKLRALGYRPTIALEDGLPGTVAWYAANRKRRPAP